MSSLDVMWEAEDCRLSLRDDSGNELWTSAASGSAIPIVIGLRDFAGWDASPLTPRLTLRLQAGLDKSAVVHSCAVVWRTQLGIDASALRAELLTELDWIFTQWLERGLDRVGPRETAFLSTAFDANTGEPLAYLDGGAHPFYALLGRALEVEDDERWRAAYDAYLTDLFALAFHPETGLPRVWNVRSDQPDDETPREVAYAFGHLLDIAERGPEEWRDQGARASGAPRRRRAREGRAARR